MAGDRDAILLESVRVHRARLRAAFLQGEQLHRRRTSDNVRRFVGGVVLAAVLCAGCTGVSFVRANADSLRGSPVPASPTPSSPAISAAADPVQTHR